MAIKNFSSRSAQACSSRAFMPPDCTPGPSGSQHLLNVVVLGSYTFSRLLNDGPQSNSWLGDTSTGSGWGLEDLNNIRGEWSRSAGDVPHRLVFSWGYELPVGRGKRLGGQTNRWVNGVVGGWQINGILAWQSGQPLNVGMANPRLADGNQRPNVTGNPRTNYSIKQVVDG